MDIITKRCSSITIFLHSLLRKFCIQTQLRIAYSLMNISISIGSFHIQVVQCSLECIQVVLKYFYPRLIIEQNQLRIYSFLPKQWIHQRILFSAQLHFPTSWRPKQNWESLSSASATAVGEEYRRLNKSSRHRSSRTYSGKKAYDYAASTLMTIKRQLRILVKEKTSEKWVQFNLIFNCKNRINGMDAYTWHILLEGVKWN